MGDNLLEEPLPPPQLDDGIPPLIPPRERHGPNVNFMRIPPMLKEGHDISLFLQRFEGYADASHIHGEDRVNSLLSLLDDGTLSAIERHLANPVTYQQLVAILRRESGLDQLNREVFISQLRARKRAKGESVRTFFQNLYQLAKKSYPQNDDVASNALRENFIYNLNDHRISSRLREYPQLNNEQLLEMAVTLEACQGAPPGSSKTVTDINAVTTKKDEESSDKIEKTAKTKTTIDSLAGMMEELSTQVMAAIATAGNKPVSAKYPEGEQMDGSGGYHYYEGSVVNPGTQDPDEWRTRPGFCQDYPDQGGYYDNPSYYLRTRREFDSQNYRPRRDDDQGFWNNGTESCKWPSTY